MLRCVAFTAESFWDPENTVFIYMSAAHNPVQGFTLKCTAHIFIELHYGLWYSINHTKPYCYLGFISISLSACSRWHSWLDLNCCQYRNKTFELSDVGRANGVMLTSQKLTYWYKHSPTGQCPSVYFGRAFFAASCTSPALLCYWCIT